MELISDPGGPVRWFGMNATTSLCPRSVKNRIHISMPFTESVPEPCLKRSIFYDLLFLRQSKTEIRIISFHYVKKLYQKY